MATEGQQSNPGGVWGGFDDFLGILTKTRDAVFQSWDTYNLFSGEGSSGASGYLSIDDRPAPLSTGSWTDPAADNQRLMIWLGVGVAAVAVAVVVLKK